MNWRYAIGLTLLTLQCGAVVRARFSDDRYFCWAPFDQQTNFRIVVEKLTPQEIQRRYRRPAKGVDNRSAHHIFDIVRRAEESLAPSDRRRVEVYYAVNGGEERVWRYPE